MLPLLQSKGISQHCFLRQYLTRQRCSSPSRMVSVGLLTAGLPFRAEEEGGPGQATSKTYVLIRVKKSQAEWGLQAERQFPALTLESTGGNFRKSQLAGPCFSWKMSTGLQDLRGLSGPETLINLNSWLSKKGNTFELQSIT